MWLVGVVSRRQVWLVDGIYGCCYWVLQGVDIFIIIFTFPYSTCIRGGFGSNFPTFCSFLKCFFIHVIIIIESVDSITRDERRFSIDAIHYKWGDISR